MTVDGDEGELASGEMTVVPAKAPHGVRNIGEETAAVVGFFPRGEVRHVFDEPVMPYEMREFVSKDEHER